MWYMTWYLCCLYDCNVAKYSSFHFIFMLKIGLYIKWLISIFINYFFFFCAGEPAPEVSWFIDDRPVTGKLEKAGANVLVNKLSVTSVKRQHLNTTFKCQASNTNLMQPSEKTVRLEMFRKSLKNVELRLFIVTFTYFFLL